MKFFDNWKKKKARLVELERQAAQREARKNYIDERKASSEPWYELIGEPYRLEAPPLASVSERYLWNDAFVLKLRSEGHRGEYAHDVIHDWEKSNELLRAKVIREKEVALKKASDEPWVELVSDEYDQDAKQVGIKLDWNNAFIRMLKEHGFRGNNDDELIDKWIKSIAEQTSLDRSFNE